MPDWPTELTHALHDLTGWTHTATSTTLTLTAGAHRVVVTRLADASYRLDEGADLSLPQLLTRLQGLAPTTLSWTLTLRGDTCTLAFTRDGLPEPVVPGQLPSDLDDITRELWALGRELTALRHAGRV